MIFQELVSTIFTFVKRYDKENDFQAASEKLEDLLFGLPPKEFLPLVSSIGIIPEQIEHDSKEEKLFTKVSEIILARCYKELGYKVSLYVTRGDTADVFAESRFHGYTLVSDAKAFRLSRTAKNQKDFKVESMDTWRRDNDYAVLCCPYFQYPKNKSAIYKQAIERNVSLFSWEWFVFLIQNHIHEDINTDLSYMWNFSKTLSEKTIVSKAEENFLKKQDEFLVSRIGNSMKKLEKVFSCAKASTILRGESEIDYWESRIGEIRQYSREQAVDELIVSLKLNEKIKTIRKYIDGLRT